MRAKSTPVPQGFCREVAAGVGAAAARVGGRHPAWLGINRQRGMGSLTGRGRLIRGPDVPLFIVAVFYLAT